MDVSKTICAALILVSAWSLALAQSSQTRIVVSVSKATFLALAAPSSGVQAVSGVASGGHLLVRMRQQASGDPVRISVLARSNTAYRVTARILNAGLASQLTVRPADAELYSGTEHVMPNALNVRFEPASVVSTSAQTPIFEGPRISKRGNQTTPGNAIVLTLYVEMPKDLNDAELLLQMDPQP